MEKQGTEGGIIMKSRWIIAVLSIISLSAFVFPITADAALTKITASDESGYTYFGNSLSISDTYTVIGAQSANSGKGAAYIFDRNAGWAQSAKLTAKIGAVDDGAVGDAFGNAVAVYGNYVIIGAPYNKNTAIHAGAVYIFKGNTWTQPVKLTADNVEKLLSSQYYKYQDDRFGSSVAIYGNYAVVGAPYDSDKVTNAGSVYVFKLNGTAWTPIIKLTATDAAAYDFFGASVGVYSDATAGDYIVVGAPGRDDKGDSSGGAYIFKFDKTTGSWVQQKISAGDGAAGDAFGTSVSVSGNNILVGAPGKTGNKGAAYLFQLSGTQQTVFTASDGAANDYFGTSVSVSGATAIVGANRKDGSSADTGAAYLFKYDGTAWSATSDKYPIKNLLSPDDPVLNANDYFGGAVATSGDYFVIGASGNKGAAYISTTCTTGCNFTPTISSIPDQYASSSSPINLSFTVSDEETGTLTLSAVSDNTTILPASGITLSTTSVPVSGKIPVTVNMTLAPVSGQYGKANITVTVKDSGNKQSTRTFMLNVAHLPAITQIPDQTINEDSSLGPIPFTVTDQDKDSMTISVSSSDPSLTPDSGIKINGTSSPYFAVLTSTSATLNLSITPTQYKSGSAVITITASKGGSLTDQKTFNLTVTSVNHAPTISTIAAQTINEDSTLGPVSFTVTDTDEESLTISATSSNPTLIPNANIIINTKTPPVTVTPNPTATVSLSLTPAKDANNTISGGSSTITLTVTDAANATAKTTFTVNVTAVADVPEIGVIGDQVMNEDATLTVNTSVRQGDGLAVNISVTSDNPTLFPSGSIVVNGSKTFPYSPAMINNTADLGLAITPALNKYGTANITITATDTNKASVSKIFKVTVNRINYPPTISDISDQTTNADTPTSSIPITIGDIETAATSLTLTASSSDKTLVPDANLKLGGSGTARTLIITPAQYLFGNTVITVSVTDGDGATTSKSFALTVKWVNHAPTITDLPVNPITINENMQTADIPFTIGDVDWKATPTQLTVTISSQDATLIPNDSDNVNIGGLGLSYKTLLSAQTQSLSMKLTPAKDKSGPSMITVTVSDGTLSSTGFFYLIVNAVNQPPTVSSIIDQAVDEDKTTAAIPFTVGDRETPAASLVITASSSDTTLVPNANIKIGGSGTARTLTITPTLLKFGSCIITLTVTDGNGASTSTSFTLTVNRVNHAPTIVGLPTGVISTKENTQTADISFTIGDVDADVVPTNLTVTITPQNVTLIPNDTDHVSIGNTGSIYVTNMTSQTQSVTMKLTPAQDKNGTTQITVNVTDGVAAPVTGIFYLRVDAVNQSPTITNIADQSVNADATTSAIAFTIGDRETAATNLTVTATSSDTALVPNANIKIGGSAASRTLTITPTPLKYGTCVITTTVTDANGASASTNFTLTVKQVNHAPTITGLPVTPITITENGQTGNIPFTIADADGNSVLTVTITSQDAGLLPNDNAHVSIGNMGASYSTFVTDTKSDTMKLIPAADKNGSSKITVTVTDSNNLSSTGFFYLIVNPVNQPPVFSTIADQVTEQDKPTAAIPFTVSDRETAATLLTVTASSSDTTLVPNANIRLGGTGTDRTLTITPATLKSGSCTITVTVTDGGGLSAYGTFTLTVNKINHAPTITGLPLTTPVSTNQNTQTAEIPFVIGDVDGSTVLVVSVKADDTALLPSDSDHVNIGGMNGASYSTYITDTKNLVMKLTPGANKTGSTKITVTVSDGALSSSGFFYLVVNQVNQSPTIAIKSGQTLTTDEGKAISVGFTVSDVETPAASLTLTASSSDTSVVPTANIVPGGTGTDRTLTVTPIKSGTCNITATVTDGSGLSSNTTFALTVTYVNKAPTITGLPTSYSMAQNGTAQVSFTVADTETPAASLTVTTTSSNVNLVPNAYINLHIDGSGATRTLYIKPAQNAITAQVGTSNIVVTVDDNSGTANAKTTATLVLTVTPVNQAPTISNFPATYSVKEGSTGNTIALTVADTDSALTAITGTVKSSNQQLVPDANLSFTGTGASRTLTITPKANANSKLLGTADITVTISDNDPTIPQTSSYTLTLTVDPLAAPVISNPPTQLTTDEGSSVNSSFDVRDSEGGILTISITSSNTTLVPVDNDHIKIQGFGSSYMLTAAAGQSYPISMIIIPAQYQNGFATLTITVKDPQNNSASWSFFVQVNPINNPPVISGLQTIVAAADGTATSPITFNVSDPEGGVIVVTAKSLTPLLVPDDSAHLNIGNLGTTYSTASLAAGALANVSLVVTPLANVSGDATISITAKDSVNASSSPQTFTVRITMGTKPPVISGLPTDPYSTNMNTRTPNIPITVTAKQSGLLTISVTSSDTVLVPVDDQHINIGPFGPTNYPINAIANAPATLNLRILPATDKVGTAIITVTVKDQNSLSAQSSFILQVNPAPSAPVISGLPAQTSTNEETPITLSFTVSDVQGGAIKIAASSSYANLVPNDSAHILLNAIGNNLTLNTTAGKPETVSLKLIPAPNNSGNTTITVTATDDSNLTATSSFTLVVNMGTHPPTISGLPLNLSTTQDTATVPSNFTVSDTNAGIVSVTVTSSNTTLVPNDSTHVLIGTYGNSYAQNFGASGGSFTLPLKLVPATKQYGFATITITAKNQTTNLVGTVSAVLQVSKGPDVLPGDIDNNGTTDLADAINVLRILAGISVSPVNTGADVNGDGKIGMEEEIYILQKIAGLR
jgi:hypothetical protein